MDFKTAVDRLLRRNQDYRSVFDGPIGARVLADICKAGHLTESTVCISQQSGMVDPIATGIAEGERRMALRILKYTTLTYDQIVGTMQDLDD